MAVAMKSTRVEFDPEEMLPTLFGKGQFYSLPNLEGDSLPLNFTPGDYQPEDMPNVHVQCGFMTIVILGQSHNINCIPFRYCNENTNTFG